MDLTEILGIIGLSAQVIVQGAFLIIASNRIVEGLVKPLFEKFGLDAFWLMYVSWGVGGVLVALGEINLFVTVLPALIWGVLPGRIVGIVLSALVAGGGANLINDLLKAIGQRAGHQVMHRPDILIGPDGQRVSPQIMHRPKSGQ